MNQAVPIPKQDSDTELVQRYNQQSGKNIALQQKRGLPAVLRFLSPNTQTR